MQVVDDINFTHAIIRLANTVGQQIQMRASLIVTIHPVCGAIQINKAASKVLLTTLNGCAINIGTTAN